MYQDLREWLEQVDQMGELIRIEGADWKDEVGAICYLSPLPTLLSRFEGYPDDYKVLVSMGAGRNSRMFFHTANWSSSCTGTALVRAWKEHLDSFRPVPPAYVESGPVMENVFTEEQVDLLKFPVPRWHEGDGGRYLGTAGVEVLRDPETGRINLGTYRMQLRDSRTLSIYLSEGKDGFIIREKYFRRGEPCPIVAVFGVDPGLLMASSSYQTTAVSELDFAGWLKGQPEPVIRGPVTGLPIPARAEIAVEGFMKPGDVAPEGPFGEASGYSEERETAVVRVAALYHRDSPILTGHAPTYHPPGAGQPRSILQASAQIWRQIEAAGIREIHGVASYFDNRLVVVSIRNSYAGHSRQAGLAVAACHRGAYFGNWVIVVDEDIDPDNLGDVLWAVMTRSEARRAIDIIDYCWASHLSLLSPSRAFSQGHYPLLPERATYRSEAIIDACRPVEWDSQWHRIVKPSEELQDRVLRKWGDLFKLERRDSSLAGRERGEPANM